ncbi:MAG: Holliday junction branch migration protein RuvA [Candidatus Paceibacterota bacterium]|jgi:Holliday junction DNA helicase RuvA
MIGHIAGTITYIGETFAIVSAHGVGYKIYATKEHLERLRKESEAVSLWTHLVVRDDALVLYGFENKDALDFFELLITISGIGPKTALGILNTADINSLRKAIRSGDLAHLVKVSGIGRKNAEKIILELKGKLGISDDADISLRDEVDALEALKALGYGHREAREALQEVAKNISDTSERIRAALKILGK